VRFIVPPFISRSPTNIKFPKTLEVELPVTEPSFSKDKFPPVTFIKAAPTPLPDEVALIVFEIDPVLCKFNDPLLRVRVFASVSCTTPRNGPFTTVTELERVTFALIAIWLVALVEEILAPVTEEEIGVVLTRFTIPLVKFIFPFEVKFDWKFKEPAGSITLIVIGEPEVICKKKFADGGAVKW
jgi:hypothetical protein